MYSPDLNAFEIQFPAQRPLFVFGHRVEVGARLCSVLVTGGAGFIGSGFVLECLKFGHRVTVLDALTYAGHLENLVEAEGKEGFRLVEGDIRDAARVGALLQESQPDALVHFAAESHVDRSITGPADFIQTNVVGTFNLLEESRRKRLDASKRSKFVYLQVSTDEVYGELGDSGFLPKLHHEPQPSLLAKTNRLK